MVVKRRRRNRRRKMGVRRRIEYSAVILESISGVFRQSSRRYLIAFCIAARHSFSTYLGTCKGIGIASYPARRSAKNGTSSAV